MGFEIISILVGLYSRLIKHAKQIAAHALNSAALIITYPQFNISALTWKHSHALNTTRLKYDSHSMTTISTHMMNSTGYAVIAQLILLINVPGGYTNFLDRESTL